DVLRGLAGAAPGSRKCLRGPFPGDPARIFAPIGNTPRRGGHSILGDRMDPQPLDPAALLAQQGWVERLARGLVRDSSLAQDLAQETWLLVARAGVADGTERKGFLAGVVRNLRRSHVRAELQRILVESVLALDESERTAVLLRYFENLSAEEIARRSGVPAGTVRSRLSRGLERLRERLEARIDRRDLLAGLCVLAREPAFPPPGASAP